jgi:hypothetical protein
MEVFEDQFQKKKRESSIKGQFLKTVIMFGDQILKIG